MNTPHRFSAHPLANLAAMLAIGLVAGCASAPQDSPKSSSAAVASAAESTVVCEREEGTGSRIQTTRCRRVADIEARRNHDREMAEKIPTVVPDVR